MWPCCLSNVGESACNQAVIEAIVEGRRIFDSMVCLLDSTWDGFCCCCGMRETYILYDGVNESMLHEFIRAIIMFLYVDTNIVSWMPLIFYVQAKTLKFLHNV